jgi:hypothetical protein
MQSLNPSNPFKNLDEVMTFIQASTIKGRKYKQLLKEIDGGRKLTITDIGKKYRFAAGGVILEVKKERTQAKLSHLFHGMLKKISPDYKTKHATKLQSLAEKLYDTSKAAPNTQQKLEEIVKITEEKYPFEGYSVPTMNQSKDAASFGAIPAIQENKMTLKSGVSVPGIGNVSNAYFWKNKPSIDAKVPSTIKDAGVYLPKSLSGTEFNKMRQFAQEGVVSGKGITPQQAQNIALSLGGVTIEANLPYKAGALLNNKGPDVEIHCIFQTGLNFAGQGGGGIPLTHHKSAEKKIYPFSQKNADAALTSAIRNKSDILVFNLGIGTGFFGGPYGDKVRKANVKAICTAATRAKANGEQIEIVVPNANLSLEEKQELMKAGIRIVNGDKDAFAALAARAKLKVSNTVAGDPMSILGIHGPGFWWETAGSASDEERAAFLSPSYALGHIPINIYEVGKPPQKIAALSEFMLLAKGR